MSNSLLVQTYTSAQTKDKRRPTCCSARLVADEETRGLSWRKTEGAEATAGSPKIASQSLSWTLRQARDRLRHLLPHRNLQTGISGAPAHPACDPSPCSPRSFLIGTLTMASGKPKHHVGECPDTPLGKKSTNKCED